MRPLRPELLNKIYYKNNQVLSEREGLPSTAEVEADQPRPPVSRAILEPPLPSSRHINNSAIGRRNHVLDISDYNAAAAKRNQLLENARRCLAATVTDNSQKEELTQKETAKMFDVYLDDHLQVLHRHNCLRLPDFENADKLDYIKGQFDASIEDVPQEYLNRRQKSRGYWSRALSLSSSSSSSLLSKYEKKTIVNRNGESTLLVLDRYLLT